MGKAMYIDAEGTFRPQRLLQIAERYRILLTCNVFSIKGISNIDVASMLNDSGLD